MANADLRNLIFVPAQQSTAHQLTELCQIFSLQLHFKTCWRQTVPASGASPCKHGLQYRVLVYSVVAVKPVLKFTGNLRKKLSNNFLFILFILTFFHNNGVKQHQTSDCMGSLSYA